MVSLSDLFKPAPSNQNLLVATLGSYETTLSLKANQTNFLWSSFTPNTALSGTIYLSNTSQIPLGSTQNVNLTFVSWIDGQQSVISLDNYKFGIFVSNLPIGNLYIQNNYPVQISLYIQYTLKQYSDLLAPSIQNLTQLSLQPVVITPTLSAGTNFRFQGVLNNFVSSAIPLSTSFYVLDQQAIGTSSTATGSVSIPWVSNYTETLSVPALGSSEDNTTYSFVCDSITHNLPTSATQTNSSVNWVVIDYSTNLAIANFTISNAYYK